MTTNQIDCLIKKMQNLLFSLPPALIQHVFEYDNTYRKEYQEVMWDVRDYSTLVYLKKHLSGLTSHKIPLLGNRYATLFLPVTGDDYHEEFYFHFSSTVKLVTTALQAFLPLLRKRHSFHSIHLFERVDGTGQSCSILYDIEDPVRAEDLDVPFECKRVMVRNVFYYDNLHILASRQGVYLRISCDIPCSPADIMEKYHRFFRRLV